MSSVNDLVYVDKINGSGEPTKFKTQTTMLTASLPAFTGGDISSSAGSLTLTIVTNAVTTTKIINSAVTNAKLANMAANTVKANNTSGTAAPSDVSMPANTFLARASTGNLGAYTCTDYAISLLDDTSDSAARTTLGLGTMATQNANAVSLTGAMQTNSIIGSTAGDSRLLMSGGSGSPTKAFTINYSAALDAQGNMTFQRRTTADGFEAVVGGYLLAANQWFFGAAVLSSYFMGISGNTGIAGNLTLTTAGNKLAIKEGTNATMGTATLVAGTVVVSTTAVTANSRIYVFVQTAGGTQGFLRVSARTAGTSFTITSTNATETSTFAWLIIEPAP